MEKKFCPKCEKNKIVSDFNKNKSRNDGLQNYCRECQKKIDKFFQPKRDLTKKRKQQKTKTLESRQEVINYLKKNPCVDCGEKNVIVLEFDHRDNKTMNVTDMVTRGYSLERVFKEIAKCDVRCANCHRIKTSKQFGWHEGLKL